MFNEPPRLECNFGPPKGRGSLRSARLTFLTPILERHTARQTPGGQAELYRNCAGVAGANKNKVEALLFVASLLPTLRLIEHKKHTLCPVCAPSVFNRVGSERTWTPRKFQALKAILGSAPKIASHCTHAHSFTEDQPLASAVKKKSFHCHDLLFLRPQRNLPQNARFAHLT